MGKRSKNLRSQRRKERKRSAKAARKALYLSYANQGKARTRGTSKKLGWTAEHGNHVMADCGNPGCGKCCPQFVRRSGKDKSKKATKAA